MDKIVGSVLAPSDEEARLENLKKYKVLYSKREPVFDQLAAFTATMLNTPIAMINFVDRDKVWTKANQSGEVGNTVERESSLCSMAILSDSFTVYEGIVDPERPCLMSNPLLAAEVGLRFYAAVPITTREGFKVGVVCVVDQKPRTFTEEDKRQLETVAAMVQHEMSKRIGEITP